MLQLCPTICASVPGHTRSYLRVRTASDSVSEARAYTAAGYVADSVNVGSAKGNNGECHPCCWIDTGAADVDTRAEAAGGM